MESSSYGRGLGRRISTGSSTERIVFYVDEAMCEPAPEALVFNPPSERNLGRNLAGTPSSLYPPSPAELAQRSNSICSQTERPRRSRNSSDSEHSGSRRTSIHSNRSRTNSYSRPTPLGDGRRASVCRKGNSRRASTAVCSGVGSGGRRKDSIRPATRVEIRESKGKIVVKSPLELEQARRHRRITMIVIGTFLFLLIASILVVVITLTHSSFHIPPIGSKELAEHRAHHNHDERQFRNETLRKENEELLNSLNRDNSVPENATAPP